MHGQISDILAATAHAQAQQAKHKQQQATGLRHNHNDDALCIEQAHVPAETRAELKEIQIRAGLCTGAQVTAVVKDPADVVGQIVILEPVTMDNAPPTRI